MLPIKIINRSANKYQLAKHNVADTKYKDWLFIYPLKRGNLPPGVNLPQIKKCWPRATIFFNESTMYLEQLYNRKRYGRGVKQTRKIAEVKKCCALSEQASKKNHLTLLICIIFESG